MGLITDRTKERLGASDLAIVEFRRQMVQAVRDFQAGKPALGTAEPRVPITSLRAFEGVAEKTVDWRKLGVEPVPAAARALAT